MNGVYSAYQELTAEHLCWQIMDRKFAQQLFIRQEQRECELRLDDAATRYLKFRADYPGLEESEATSYRLLSRYYASDFKPYSRSVVEFLYLR